MTRFTEVELETLKRLAIRVSGLRKIKIVIGDVTSPCCDNHSLFLPNEDLPLSEGYVIHEGGHIGHGSFTEQINYYLPQFLEAKYNLSHQDARSLVNIIEDLRINTINKYMFPGFYRPFRKKLLETLELYRPGKDGFFMDLAAYYEDLVENFQGKISENALEVIDKAKEIIQQNRTTMATVFAADMIGKLIQKEKEDLPKKESPPPSQQSCDGDRSKPGSLGTFPQFNFDRKHNPNFYTKDDIDDLIQKLIKLLSELDEEEKQKIIKKLCMYYPQFKNGDVQDIHDKLKNHFNKLVYNPGSFLKTRRCTEEQIKFAPMENYESYPTYKEIVNEFFSVINNLRHYFKQKLADPQKFRKRGRLNNMFVRAIISDYKKVFSKKDKLIQRKITLLVDISGSMFGSHTKPDEKAHTAKKAVVVFNEALQDIANIRVVLFSGNSRANNVVVKDFDEDTKPELFDKFGSRKNIYENLDGTSVLYEANKNKGGYIIVFSDGQPAGHNGYGMEEAVFEIYKAKKMVKGIYAFSIDAHGRHLLEMYGRGNFTTVYTYRPRELIGTLLKFGRLLINCLV